MRIGLLLWGFFILSSYSQEVEWKEKEQNYKAKLHEKGISFVFSFTNKTSKQVKVEKIYTPCDCVKIVSKTPLVVDSGKVGEIHLTYNTLGRSGTNKSVIQVTIDGVETELNIEVDIPLPLEIFPRFIIWKSGEAEQKEVVVKVHPEWRGKITGVKGQNNEIQAELVKNEQGFIIKVTPPPAQDRKKSRIWLSLEGTEENGQALDQKIYLMLN